MSGTMNNPVPQPTAPSGNGSPVVTEGRAGTGGPYEDFFSTYERLRELNKPAAPPPGPMGITPSQQRGLDQLGAFGAALASTRSPNFMGAFGEGIRAVQQTEATQRTEARQEQQDERQRQQANMEAAYRAAQEARQAAELRWNQNRQNPRYILDVAQARNIESQIAERLRRASIESQTERLGQGVQTIDRETGRAQMEYPGAQGGRPVVRPLQGDPVASPAAVLANQRRIEAMVERAYETAKAVEARILQNSPSILTPAQITAQSEAAGRREGARVAAGQGMNPEEIARRFGSAPAPASAPDVRRGNWER